MGTPESSRFITWFSVSHTGGVLATQPSPTGSARLRHQVARSLCTTCQRSTVPPSVATATRLQGIPVLKPVLYSRIAKNKKNVSRAYGGSRCAKCVRERIVRAFLIEEQKIVKQVLKKQKKAEKK